MNAFDQFDIVDTRIAGAIDDLAAASRPDYITDVLAITAASRQRPRWTFLERLLPMDTTMRRPMGLRRVPLVPFVLLLLLLIAAVGVAIYAGSRPRLAPFGPAANGQVLYIANNDVYIRDGLDKPGKLLVPLAGDQFFPTWSPDGQWIAFVTIASDADLFMVARADGSDVHQIATIPKTGNAQAAWRPDGRAIGLIHDDAKGIPRLSIASVEGLPTQQIDMNFDVPKELAWRPPNGAELLVRVIKDGGAIDYITIRPDGTGRHDFNLPSSELMGLNWNNPAAAWSPDGSRVAYTRITPGGDPASGPFRTHVVLADGTGDVELPGAPDLTIRENWPVFSPDGRWILINRWRPETETSPPEAWLAVMASDGSAPARDIGPRFTGSQEIQLAKAWSPDGTRVLAFQAEDGGAVSIDPVSGEAEALDWTTEMPDIQRTLP
jgi:dipeptidyl aminopeptidase/acylaminoacyl peptidase